MADSFAISTYPDVPRILSDLDSLIRQPIRRLRPAALDRYLDEYFEKTCSRSKSMIDEAKNYIPGGVQHNLAFNYPFPLVFTKAAGPYLYDLDGHRYFDFLQAGGPTILGSNPPEVLNQVLDLLKTCGPSTGLFNEYELKLARFIANHMPAVPMFRMLGSGTEGCMAAIRVARLATGRRNVVKMGGAYHGWSDQLAYGLRIPGSRHFEAHGVPEHVFKHTQEFFPGDLDALERVLRRNRLGGGTAAVMIEPLGPESGTRPVAKDFNSGVRRLCDKFGALLIFDEVVTGFRVGLSGAQGYFGVEPDLTVFGKVVAGGHPSAGGSSIEGSRVLSQPISMAFVTVLDLSTDISVHRFTMISASREVEKMKRWRRHTRLRVARGVYLGVLAFLPSPKHCKGYCRYGSRVP